MSPKLFFEVVEAAKVALEPINLGGTIGTVYVRPMSAEQFYEYVEEAEALNDEPPAFRQARLLFNHARNERGDLVFLGEDEKQTLNKLVGLPFGMLQKFSQSMLKINGLIKEDEKND